MTEKVGTYQKDIQTHQSKKTDNSMAKNDKKTDKSTKIYKENTEQHVHCQKMGVMLVSNFTYAYV